MKLCRTETVFVLAIESLLLSGPAYAQSSTLTTTTAAAAAADRARKLHADGARLFEEKKFEQAYVAFFAAWAIKKHWSIAGNLADCEVKLGKYRDAAEHYRYVIKNGAPPALQQRGQERLTDILKHIAVLTVVTNADGAELTLDGSSIGQTPLADTVFLDPGLHTIEARIEGHLVGKRSVNVAAGSSTTIQLVPPTDTAEPFPPNPPPLPPQVPAPEPRMGIGWVVATGVLAAGSLGAGIGLTVAANGKGSDATTLNAGLGPSACFNPARAGAANCAAIKTALNNESSLRNAATASFIGSGLFALAAGSLGIWSATASKTTDERKPAMQLVPVVGAQDMGIVFVGAW